jgi:hypothetical protein
MVLLAEFQLAGTVQLVLEVRKMVIGVEGGEASVVAFTGADCAEMLPAASKAATAYE